MKRLLINLWRRLFPLPERPPTSWQLIFLQSKVNGGRYYGDDLPAYRWEWPERKRAR